MSATSDSDPASQPSPQDWGAGGARASATSNVVERDLALDHGRLHYRESGADGPPLVYLHGAELPRWGPALAALARAYRVYVPDLPGCGQSDPLDQDEPAVADGLAAFIRGVVPGGKAHLVGASRGATLALWVAVRHPAAVERLVVAAPTAFVPPGAGRPDRTSEQARQPEDLPGRAATEAAWDADLDERLPALDAPVLALFGTRDALVPGTLARRYRARLPHCHVIFVYNAGHAIADDRPDAFARLVDEFLTYGEGFVRNRGSTGYMRAPAGTAPTGWAVPDRPGSR